MKLTPSVTKMIRSFRAKSRNVLRASSQRFSISLEANGKVEPVRSRFAPAFAAFALFCASPAIARTAPAPIGRQQVEIYRIAPGQHEAFLRFIARCDEANRIAGLPPRQLFVHSDGADWDFLLIQPYDVPADKQAALDAAWKKVGLPSGADFFLAIRQYIAVHTDTMVHGPTTAADYLATRAAR